MGWGLAWRVRLHAAVVLHGNALEMVQICALPKHARALRGAKSEDSGAGGRGAQMAKGEAVR